MSGRLRWCIAEPNRASLERLDRLLGHWPAGVGVARLAEPTDIPALLQTTPAEIIFGPSEPGFWQSIKGHAAARIALGGSAEDAEQAAEQGLDGYLARPYRMEKVAGLCARLSEQLSSPTRLWALDGAEWRLIDGAQIRCAEYKDRQTWLFTGQGRFKFPHGLQALHRLRPDLIRIHRHLLIAPQWVTDLGQQGVRIEGHPSRLPVSRRQKKEVTLRVLQADYGLMPR